MSVSTYKAHLGAGLGNRKELPRTAPAFVDLDGCEQALKDAMAEQDFAGLPFSEASRLWLNEHKRYIGERTLWDYEQFLRRLNEFFGTFILREIHIGHIRKYQDWRRQPRCYAFDAHGKKIMRSFDGAGPETINKELSALQQILRESNLWKNHAHLYRALPVDREGSGQSLTKEQEDKLVECCKKRFGTRAELAARCVLIGFRIGAGFGEIRKLRRKDIDLQNARMYIWFKTKNQFRKRTIPLKSHAFESVCWLVERWAQLGGCHPDQFLLPHRAHKAGGPTEFDRPMGSIKKAWWAIQKEAGLKEQGFRLYDLRPNAMTKTLSDPKIPLHAQMKYYGHISQEMTKRYYKPHIEEMEKISEALDKL